MPRPRFIDFGTTRHSYTWSNANRRVTYKLKRSGETAFVSALDIQYAASAVNYLRLAATAATVDPVLSAVGTDTNISLVLTAKGSGTISISSPLTAAAAGGAACGGLVLGAGTDASPMTTAVASKNFIQFYGESTATGAGSDTRVAYMRLYLNGITTGGGEALRAYTTVEKAIGTARGAHISLDYAAAGFTSGLATAVTATMHIPATGAMTGNLAAIQAEMWYDADDGDATIPTEHGILRLSVSNDASNAGKIMNAIHGTGLPTAAADESKETMVLTAAADCVSDTRLRCRINGTNYVFMLSTDISPATN